MLRWCFAFFQKVLYLLLLWPCFIWSIVGASLVGQTGICSNKEKPCYYSVKKWQNRTVAIVTIVIHVLNGILTLWILTSRHKIRRDATCENGAVLQKHAKDIHPTTLNLKPPYFNAKNEKKQKDEEDSNKIKLSAIKDPQSLQKHKNIFEPNSISVQFHQTYENKQDFFPPIKKPLKRYHTVHDGQIGLASGTNFNYDAKDPKTSKIKPLSSKKKTNRLLRTGKRVTKLRIVAPQHRSASFNHSGALYSDSDGSSGNVDRRLHANDTNGFLIRRMSEHPRAPPPSYNEIIEQSDTDPYWLPPLPENNPKTHNLPENIYSGYSYPDTAPVPVYPEKVPKAQWQIGDA